VKQQHEDSGGRPQPRRRDDHHHQRQTGDLQTDTAGQPGDEGKPGSTNDHEKIAGFGVLMSLRVAGAEPRIAGRTPDRAGDLKVADDLEDDAERDDRDGDQQRNRKHPSTEQARQHDEQSELGDAEVGTPQVLGPVAVGVGREQHREHGRNRWDHHQPVHPSPVPWAG
jgi:hypothetical protein